MRAQQPRSLAWRGGEPGHEPVLPSLFHVRVRVCLGCGALWLRLSIAVAEEGSTRVECSVISQGRPIAGPKGRSALLDCIAKGYERYIESAAAHASSVSLVSAVVRGRLTCTKAGEWGLAPFPCAQTSAGVIWKLRHGACPNDEQPATTPTPYQTPPPPPPPPPTRNHHRSAANLYVCFSAHPSPRLVTPPSPQSARQGSTC